MTTMVEIDISSSDSTSSGHVTYHQQEGNLNHHDHHQAQGSNGSNSSLHRGVARHRLPSRVTVIFVLSCVLGPTLYGYMTYSELLAITWEKWYLNDQRNLLMFAPIEMEQHRMGLQQPTTKSNEDITSSSSAAAAIATTTTIKEVVLDDQQKVLVDTRFLLLPGELEAINNAVPEEDDRVNDSRRQQTLTAPVPHNAEANTAAGDEDQSSPSLGAFSFANQKSNRIVFLDMHGAVADPPHDIYYSSPVNHRDYPIFVDPLPPDLEEGEDKDWTRTYSQPHITEADLNRTIERRQWPVDELDPENCEPMYKWQSKSFLTCNSIHEMDMRASYYNKSLTMLSARGFWRYVWLKNETATDGTNTSLVWKTTKIEHGMEEAFFENSRVDAVTMERLTSSPYVIDIYGYCGLTVVNSVANRNLGQIATLSRAPVDRLDLAIEVAQAVADVHAVGADEADGDESHDGPSIVHNDINLANIIITPDDRPVLNDFNVAILLKKHKVTGETCPYYSKFPNSQWRAPEEQVLHDENMQLIQEATQYPIATHKTDVYALGNLLFRIAYVRSPWKVPGSPRFSAEEKDEIARAKRFDGKKPEIPLAMRNVTDPFTQTIAQAIEMCFRHHPEDRPSAQDIVKFLQDGMTKYNQTANSTTSNDSTINVTSTSNNTATANLNSTNTEAASAFNHLRGQATRT